MLISANLQLHPSFFILFYPKISRSEILLIPNDKSYGLYSSPTKLLKCSSVVIVPVLTEILNTSIRLGTYPSKQKFAKITPVFKSDDDTDTNNYRPISLLSNFNRVFEKIICNRLTRYIKNTNFCIPHNTAFVRGIQPNTQYWTSLMIYKQTWIRDCYLVECSLIFKKACDTVDHDILLDKLDHYIFLGIINYWFSSYLKYRTQTT